MFSCMSSSDVTSAVGADGSTGGETIDRILTEAAKLKRKCKSLRVLLLETETKRSEEKEHYEQVIAELRKELDTRIADLEAKHYIELHQLQNYRSNEYDVMANDLLTARNETSMQGALIITMTHKIATLERELQGAEALQTDNNSKEPFSSSDPNARLCNRSYDDEYVNGLVERMQRAEAALAKATIIRSTQLNPRTLRSPPPTSTPDSCARCNELSLENAQLKAALAIAQAPAPSSARGEDHSHENQKLRDELAFFREENNRLERQVELIKRDLEALTPAAPASVSSPRTHLERVIFRPSEKERLHKDLTDAHRQVSELKSTVQELVLTKSTVEQAVRSVLQDNEQLTRTVESLNLQLQQLKQSSTVLA